MNCNRLYAALAIVAGAFIAACGPEEANLDALCASRLPGDVVISEFLVDPDGTDTGKEFIELYNASGKELDLKNLSITHSDLSGAGTKKHSFRTQAIPAGGYLAVGDNREEPKPAWMGYSYGDDLGALRNTGGKFQILCGAKVIDEVSYADGGKPGRSRELNGSIVPDSSINDVLGNYCNATKPFEGQNFGTPGAPNSQCGVVGGGTCLDAISGESRTAVTPLQGEVIFTEFMADPSAVADDAGEWIELYSTMRTIDLNGLVLQSGSSKTTLQSETCLTIGAGSYAVLARGADPATNGGLPLVTALITSTLANSNGTLSLLSGETVIDQISWLKAQSGAATQLSPEALDAEANDDALNFCVATRDYGTGGDKGTPGAANSTCPVIAPPGECIDEGTGLSRPIVKPAGGALVISEWMADPSAVADGAGEWFEVTANSAFDLNDLTIQVGAAGTPAPIVSGGCLHLDAGQQAIFAHGTDPALNGGLPFVTAKFTAALVNSNGVLAIKDGVSVLDQVTWTSSTSGVATQITPTAIDPISNDDVMNHCAATQIYGAGMDKGTPGGPNSMCGGSSATTCIDPGTMMSRDIVPPLPGQLVITEFMADPSAVADGAGEWFEVLATAEVDLNGVQAANEGTGNATVTAVDCLRLLPGQYALFAHGTDAAINGGLPPVTSTFGFALGNSKTAAGLPRAIILKSGAGEIDRISWLASTPGASTQLDGAKLDAVSNDDAMNLCATPAGTVYGAGDRGTPAAVNGTCQ